MASTAEDWKSDSSSSDSEHENDLQQQKQTHPNASNNNSNTFNEERADSRQVNSALDRPKTSRNRSTDSGRDSSVGDSSNTNENVRIESRKNDTKSPNAKRAQSRSPSEKQARSANKSPAERKNKSKIRNPIIDSESEDYVYDDDDFLDTSNGDGVLTIHGDSDDNNTPKNKTNKDKKNVQHKENERPNEKQSQHNNDNANGKASKSQTILVEKNGKYTVTDIKDLTAEERELYLVESKEEETEIETENRQAPKEQLYKRPETNNNDDRKSTTSSKGTAASHSKPRSKTAQASAARKRKEEEEKERRERERQAESNRAFEAWLKKKRSSDRSSADKQQKRSDSETSDDKPKQGEKVCIFTLHVWPKFHVSLLLLLLLLLSQLFRFKAEGEKSRRF
jgi:hypothetical protein